MSPSAIPCRPRTWRRRGSGSRTGAPRGHHSRRRPAAAAATAAAAGRRPSGAASSCPGSSRRRRRPRMGARPARYCLDLSVAMQGCPAKTSVPRFAWCPQGATADGSPEPAAKVGSTPAENVLQAREWIRAWRARSGPSSQSEAKVMQPAAALNALTCMRSHHRNLEKSLPRDVEARG